MYKILATKKKEGTQATAKKAKEMWFLKKNSPAAPRNPNLLMFIKISGNNENSRKFASQIKLSIP